MLAITGSTGFVGGYVSQALPFPQKKLIRRPVEPASECIYILGDLADSNATKKLVEGCSTLIHFACTSNPRSANANIVQDIEGNLITTIKLFETFAKEHPNGHIIFASTGGNMYQVDQPHLPRTENDLPEPQSSYSIHKLSIENYLRLFCHLYGIKATVLRISNPYGSILPPPRAHGLIGVAFAKVLMQQPLPIIDALASVRDYLHLEDVAAAFNLVIQHPPLPKEFRLFNVSSGVGYRILEILENIEAVTGCQIHKQYLHEQAHQPKPSWSVLSYEKIHRTLGWAPKISLLEGLKSTWQTRLRLSKHLHQPTAASHPQATFANH